MTENPEDPDKFTPTDWDWVMFLSGEINAIEARSDTVWAVGIATLSAWTGFAIMFMGFLITGPRISFSNPDSIATIIIGIIVVTIIIGYICILRWYNKYKHEAKKRVESLKECRENFRGLDDPNKILECVFKRC